MIKKFLEIFIDSLSLKYIYQQAKIQALLLRSPKEKMKLQMNQLII